MPSNETNACPASEEMPDEAIESLWRELREHRGAPIMRLSPRQITGLFRLFECANEQRDEIARLTRELSESRARAVQGEQDTKDAAHLAWVFQDFLGLHARCDAVVAEWERTHFPGGGWITLDSVRTALEAVRTSTPTPDTGRNDSDE